MTDQTPSDPRRARKLLLFITACFAIPLLLAAVLVQIWQPTGSGAHGELLDPAQPLPDMVFRQADKSLTVQELVNHHWTLLYWLSGVCEADCEKSLYYMRQVHLALGKDADRVQTVLALNESPSSHLLDWLSHEHVAMKRTLTDPDLPTFLGNAFASDDPGGWIYLVDPLGNLVMRYAVDANPDAILDDLKRLLKLSRIG